MSVIYAQKNAEAKFQLNGGGFVLVKGAPENVLLHCTSYFGFADTQKDFFTYVRETEPELLNDDFVNSLTSKSESMASNGLRVLALALRRVTIDQAQKIVDSKKPEEAENDLTFVGLIGLIDPPKNGVKESVQSCQQAGIKVVMITGDHISTALAIAKQLSIIDPSRPEQVIYFHSC